MEYFLTKRVTNNIGQWWRDLFVYLSKPIFQCFGCDCLVHFNYSAAPSFVPGSDVPRPRRKRTALEPFCPEESGCVHRDRSVSAAEGVCDSHSNCPQC